MPAFEGLRVLRLYMEQRPDDPLDTLVTLIGNIEAEASSYDMQAAVALHKMVAVDAPHQGVAFYRVCLASVLLLELPEWAKLITLGRGRFIKRLKAKEFRDVRSLFRQAKLLDDPPQLEDIEWWDSLQSHIRSHQDIERMKRARDAELLTLKHESKLLTAMAIDKAPVWMAIDDNTAGYDILSYTHGEFGLLNKLIEVKSTIASPLRFYVSRNEWDQAVQFGESFVFHIWNLSVDPPVLFERTVTQVAPHIPQDDGKGKWKTALIPVGI